jgi:hypothetical protein
MSPISRVESLVWLILVRAVYNRLEGWMGTSLIEDHSTRGLALAPL